MVSGAPEARAPTTSAPPTQMPCSSPATSAFIATIALMLCRSTFTPLLANSPASWASQMIRLLVMPWLALMATGWPDTSAAALAAAAAGEELGPDGLAVGRVLEHASSVTPTARAERQRTDRGDMAHPRRDYGVGARTGGCAPTRAGRPRSGRRESGLRDLRRPGLDVDRLRREAENIEVQVLAELEEARDVLQRHVVEVAQRRIEADPRASVQRRLVDLGDALANRRLTVPLDELPHVVVDLLEDGVVVAALLGVYHPLLEVQHLRRGRVDALDGHRGGGPVGPVVAGEEVAEEVALHQLHVVALGAQAVLGLECGVWLGVIAVGLDRVGLADVAPAVAGLGTDVLRQ